MSEINFDKDLFFKNGYCVIRNILSDEEVNQYKKNIKIISKKIDAKVVIGIHNYSEYWSIIAHKKILKVIKKLLGSEDIKYLYSSATRHEDKTSWSWSWHRDNPCRIFGAGADWNEKEIYNCVRVGVYLNSYDEVKSGINFLPASHLKRYTLSNLLRIFHHKTKNSNNVVIKFIREIFEPLIGINIKTDQGDCVFFLAPLLHSAIPHQSSVMRDAIFLTYGTDNIHSKNYVNYWIKHRPTDTDGQLHEPTDKKKEIKEFLEENNIYLPLPEKREHIDGVSIPK